MGNVIVGDGRESIGEDVVDGISDFEHCFAASCEDATDDLLPQPLPGYTPSTGPPTTRRRGSKDMINETLKGRLMTVHMMETELLLKEAVGVAEQIVLRIPYASIRVLTWDHAASGLKVDFEAKPSVVAKGSTKDAGEVDDRVDPISSPGRVFISVRVENSIDLEDELKQRARVEAVHAKNTGRLPQVAPTSVYLGVFAGFTKPKPFQRKRPNLSFTVPEGVLPTLKEMRSWSFEEHEGISRPQLYSLRPKLALDVVYLGENRFFLSAVDGLALSSTRVPDTRYPSMCGELVLNFASVKVQLRADCTKGATFSYDVIDDWSLSVVPGTGPRPPSGLTLWILLTDGEEEQGDDDDDGDDDSNDESAGSHQAKAREDLQVETDRRENTSTRRGDGGGGSGGRRCRRVFLGIPDEDIVLARNCLEYFWNARRAELRLPPKAGSTHGRCVASMVTLRGEVKAPTLPTGRIDPVDLDGVDVRVGQVIQPSPKRGQLNLLPSIRALLGVEKKRTLRHNSSARSQWERVVVHQGWLRKRGGGAIKRWIWRYFVLYDTPQGHFLAYYNDVSEVPLFSEDRKERQVVDLCKVCFLRPEIGRQRLTGIELPANAFTIVTTERQWTLAADSRAAVLEWLRMISVAVDEDVAVVDDGEILFEVKAHWAKHGGEYGSENAGTVHLGSMGMELRIGFSEVAAASLAALAGKSKKRSSSSASYANNVKFWSFTDFYKWTIVLLQDGAHALAVQCFTDDEFKKREDMLLVTPHVKRLALAIEHQVEKFMSVMHLRLEPPENTVMVSTSTQPSPSNDTISTCTANVAESSSEEYDGEEVDAETQPPDGVQTPKSTTEEMHRVPSMNLATDAASWVGDATITPCAPGRQASYSGGGINPFDSSTDEEGGGEATQAGIGAWGGDTGDVDFGPGREAGCKRSISKGSNPFDFSFTDGGEEAAAEEQMAHGRGSSIEKTGRSGVAAADPMSPITRSEAAAIAAAAAATAAMAGFPGAQSSRTREFFPADQKFSTAAVTTAAAPSPTGVASAASRETAWLAIASVDASTVPNSDQLLLTPRVPTRVQEMDLALAESLPTSVGSSARPSGPAGLSLILPTINSRPSPLVPSPAAAAGAGAAAEKDAAPPRDKRLLPTPLSAADAEGFTFCPSPTPPVTPLPIPPAKAPVDLYSMLQGSTDAQAPAGLFPPQEQADWFAAFRDKTQTPPSPLRTKQQSDLHLAFQDNTTGSQSGRYTPPPPPPPDRPSTAPQPDWSQPEWPPPKTCAVVDEVDSSGRRADFNPFGRPESFVLPHSTEEEPSPPEKVGEVLYDNGSSVRVVLEECAKLGRTFSITLRYELRVPPKTTFCVEFPGDGHATASATSSPALEISFHPSMTSVELDGASKESGGSWRKLRQVLSVACVRAFSSAPEIVLATSHQPLEKSRVALPMVTVAAFLAGLPINLNEFRQRWTALPCSEQAVVSSEEAQQQQHQEQQQRGRGEASVLSPAGIKRVLVETLGMREVVQQRPAGAVPGVELIAAAGELLISPPSSSKRSVAGAEGGREEAGLAAEVRVVCLVGVELNNAAGASRVTTKSTEAVLTESVQRQVIEGIARIRTCHAAAAAAAATAAAAEDSGLIAG